MSLPLRIATYNLENLDDRPGEHPTLAERIAVLRPALLRLRADVLCLQEVNGQETPGGSRELLALDAVLAGTPYAAFHRVSTRLLAGGGVYDERNLVILSRLPISYHEQIKHTHAQAPSYRKVTAHPPDANASEVTWERPILRATVDLPGGQPLHVLNVHLKSRIPSRIEGEQLTAYRWRSASGWAEGFFLSSMKRVGQALETRMVVDQLFDANESAWIVVCGDFNADLEEVPVQAIRGDVEETGNEALGARVLIPCERTVPEPARFSLVHHGQGRMLDHVLVSRGLLASYRATEIHNELLHDESVAFATDPKFPESDHAPVVAAFDLPGE